MILRILIEIQNLVFVICEVTQCYFSIIGDFYSITTCPCFNHYQSNADIMHLVYLNDHSKYVDL